MRRGKGGTRGPARAKVPSMLPGSFLLCTPSWRCCSAQTECRSSHAPARAIWPAAGHPVPFLAGTTSTLEPLSVRPLVLIPTIPDYLIRTAARFSEWLRTHCVLRIHFSRTSDALVTHAFDSHAMPIAFVLPCRELVIIQYLAEPSCLLALRSRANELATHSQRTTSLPCPLCLFVSTSPFERVLSQAH